MKTLIAVLTHGSAAANATLLRHLPYWEKFGHDMLICSPLDNPARLPDDSPHEEFHPGLQGHSGPIALERQKRVLEECVKRLEYDWFIVIEYDVLFFGDVLPEFQPGLSCLRNPNGEPGVRFKSRWVLGPPWVFDHGSLHSIVQYANAHPEIVEEGCIDRFLPCWAEGAGVPIMPLPQSGLFVNEITPAYYEQALGLIREGGRFFHGVKTVDCLNVLQTEYRAQYALPVTE